MATTPKSNRRLEGSELRPTPSARLLGHASEPERLSVTIVLRRRPDGPPVPEPAHYAHTLPREFHPR
jgi:kumamolisin